MGAIRSFVCLFFFLCSGVVYAEGGERFLVFGGKRGWIGNQLVQYFVNVAASAAADLLGGRIVCATWGYFWPR